MRRSENRDKVRMLLVFVFMVFLVFGVVVHTLGVRHGLSGSESLGVTGSETTSGARMLVFLLVVAVSWLLGRGLYRLLVRSGFGVGDSVNTIYILILLLALSALTLLFFGTVSWYWFPLLFLLLLVFAIITFWGLAGALGGAAALAVAVAAVAITWWLTS